MDSLLQRVATIKESFFTYNKQSYGKISKSGLQKVGKMFFSFLCFFQKDAYCLIIVPAHTARVKSFRIVSVTNELNRPHEGY